MASSGFQQAVAGAYNSLRAAAGVHVTYHRATAWVRLCAVPGKSDFGATVPEQAAVVEFRSRDYIVRTADLVIGGVQVTPQRGDLVKEEVGDKVHVHEVIRPDDGNGQPWRYSDHGRTAIRVHTKLKEIVDL